MLLIWEMEQESSICPWVCCRHAHDTCRMLQSPAPPLTSREEFDTIPISSYKCFFHHFMSWHPLWLIYWAEDSCQLVKTHDLLTFLSLSLPLPAASVRRCRATDFCTTKFSPPVVGKSYFSALFGHLKTRLHNFTGLFQPKQFYGCFWGESP